MSIEELAQSLGLSDWKTVRASEKILGRDRSTLEDYAKKGLVPFRRRYGERFYHLPTMLSLTMPMQGKRYEGGPGLTEKGVADYKAFQEELADNTKDLVFFVSEKKTGAVAMAVCVEGRSYKTAGKLPLETLNGAGE